MDENQKVVVFRPKVVIGHPPSPPKTTTFFDAAPNSKIMEVRATLACVSQLPFFVGGKILFRIP